MLYYEAMEPNKNSEIAEQPVISYGAPEHYMGSKPTLAQRLKKEYKSLIFIPFALILALILNFYVFQSFEVEGISMANTLHNKDRIIVNKTGKTYARLTGSNYTPPRSSIVIFKLKESQYNQQEKNLIKRVIGVPGDRVTVADGIVKVFNKDHPEGNNPDEIGSWKESFIGPINGRNIDLTIQPGEIFVLGDNRPNSLDSRSFGTVKSDNIIGVLSIRILPLSNAGKP
jgi:signal peptidase I